MPAHPPAAPARRLVLGLEKGLAACAAEATAYGRCVAASIETVDRHACQAQFQTFRACVQRVLGRRW
ncbi:hypothetical protein H4R18_002943 [Coemansia javaensis]|uniref:Uncharacterized protein n=1 Tax=Coemansia javaensis TaxID=2761396 RepID=A0A9W8HBQ1_9FUNG|nr:hypothetical protein H4R18_002943 [Coemansia javaensis]